MITTPHRLNDALNYNEQKVQKGNAECIYAGNYLADAGQLSFYQKLAGFETRNSLNDRATTKTLHISLNFHPSEKLDKEKMIAIATKYMERLGFGEQPFLVYQHKDAGHPHIHILTTTIKNDGKRINTHNIGRNQSEAARKAIEQEFKLKKAERLKDGAVLTEQNPELKKVIYGKDETKRAINNIVSQVVKNYCFTSLAQLNAALEQYNVIADRGKEGSRTFKKNGLLYRLLDGQGNKVGVPVKASILTGKPTLARLEKVFAENKEKREALKQPLRNVIDGQLKQGSSLAEFRQNLLEQNVFVKLRVNEEGRLYGITYIDNKQKAVFNGSELGKQYSIQGIQQSIRVPQNPGKKQTRKELKPATPAKEKTTEMQHQQPEKMTIEKNVVGKSPAYNEPIPFQLKRRKKKKKKNLNQ